MSRKIKFTLCIILSLIMIMTVFSGCSKKKDTEDTEATTTAKTDTTTTKEEGITFPLKDKITLKWMMAENVPFNEEWLTFSKLSKRTNIEFDYLVLPWGEYREKRNVMLASGTIPDMMYDMGIDDFKRLGGEGIFLNFKPYLDAGKMPNYVKYTEKFPEWNDMIPDLQGNVYIANAFLGYMIPMYLVVRGDLMEENGIQMPSTWDEMYKVLKKLKELYPDTYPLGNQTGRRILDVSVTQWGTSFFEYYNETENKWKYGPVEDNFKEFLQFFNKLYAEKLLDPEYLTNDATFFEKLYSGKVLSAGIWLALNSARSLEGQEITPGLKLVQIMPPLTVAGKNSKAPAWNGAVKAGISVNAETKNPEIVAMLIDYFYSDEIVELFNWGVEGVTFTKDAKGNRIYNDDIISGKNPNGTKDKEREYGIWNTSSGLPLIQLAGNFDPANADEQTSRETTEMLDALEDCAIYPTPKPLFTDVELETLANIKTAVETYVKENFPKFINGQLSFDAWDEYVEDIKQMGIDEYIEIYNNR